MTGFIRKYWKALVIFIAPLVMFYPSLFGFFTNDDFFFLKIAKVSSFSEFLNFFNLIKDVGGIGVYRPLTLRVFYYLGVSIFNLNPIPLHVISFVVFYLDIFLVWVLTKLLTKNKAIAFFSSFLYAVSVTHFGQLYYIGAFQEVFLTLVFLGSVIFFIKNKVKTSLFLFVLAIMSKETAVVLPLILLGIHFYLRLTQRITVSVKALTFTLLPYFVVLGIYLFLHFRYFGVISGDSYVWDFSPVRAMNSLTWYGLWSLNLPETLVDFVGPGLHLNPNLLKFWSKEIIPIFAFFAVQSLIIFYSFIKFIRMGWRANKKGWLLVLFSLFWFVVTIAPVIFLPVHKFTYYLTLPLIGIVVILGFLLEQAKINKLVVGLFLIVWVLTSAFSLHLTVQTNWITQGVKTSARVYKYFNTNKSALASKNIMFVDTEEDKSLPWSPTATLKTVLSGSNFFYVFYPEFAEKVVYADDGKVTNERGTVTIISKQFLGY